MPVPFDDLSAEKTSSRALAWMRFVEEENDEGIRAALFQTSAEGEPLAFCFTRANRHDPSPWQSGNARQGVLSSLARSLFQAADSSPVLILGLADEIPPETFANHLRVRLPICLVCPDGSPVQTGSEQGV